MSSPLASRLKNSDRLKTRIVVDLTDIERLEFEMPRIHFPIQPGETAPTLGSVLIELVSIATMLSAVIEDTGKKSKLGMDGLDAPTSP